MPNTRMRAYTAGRDLIHFYGGESTGSRQYRPISLLPSRALHKTVRNKKRTNVNSETTFSLQATCQNVFYIKYHYKVKVKIPNFQQVEYNR